MIFRRLIQKVNGLVFLSRRRLLSFFTFQLITLHFVIPFTTTAQENGSGFSLDYSLLRYFDYNRVDGVFPALYTSLAHDDLPLTSLTGRTGYGTESKEWRYSVTLRHSFDLLGTQFIEFSVFDETRTNDREILTQLENSLSTGLLRKDYRDYFRLRGVESRISYKIKENVRIAFDIGYRSYGSLANREPWSLFSRNKPYRINPPVTVGDEVLASAGFRFDTREDYFIETNYWQLEFLLEREFNDFTFTGAHFKLQRMHLGWGSQTLIAGLQGGIRNGTTAEQYLMDLGGIGSLRGYNFKEFTGTRRLMLECNYLFNGGILQKLPLQSIPVLSSLATGVFFDAGMTWFSNSDRSLFPPGGLLSGSIETGSRFRDIKSNIGISLFVLDGAGKIDIAKRLDRKKDAWKFTFRFRLLEFM